MKIQIWKGFVDHWEVREVVPLSGGVAPDEDWEVREVAPLCENGRKTVACTNLRSVLVELQTVLTRWLLGTIQNVYFFSRPQ